MYLEKTVTSKAYRHSLTFEEKEETNFEKKKKERETALFSFRAENFPSFFAWAFAEGRTEERQVREYSRP